MRPLPCRRLVKHPALVPPCYMVRADVSHAGCLKSSLYVVSDGPQSDREACTYCAHTGTIFSHTATIYAQYVVTLAHIAHIVCAAQNAVTPIHIRMHACMTHTENIL